jgi:hypothetical protein
MKINLPKVTLVGIDCVDPYRLQEAMNISELGINFAQSKLLSSKKINDPRFVEIENLDSIEKYSKFCIADLYKYIDTDFALIVQYDGFVLNPQSWQEEFLNYDYIGAPWLVQDWSVRDYNFPEEMLGKYMIGNGGFCLRSKKFLESSAKFYSQGLIPQVHPEDTAMCVWHKDLFEEIGLKFAPVDVAKNFSIEGNYFEYDKQFGFHSFKYTNVDNWFENNPGHPILLEIYKNSKM